MRTTDIIPTNELPEYLGLGVLDRTSIQRTKGSTSARYLSGDDTVYQVTVSSHKGELVEFYEGREIGRRVESSLIQTFFLHWAESNPEKNPRFGAMLTHIREDLGLHFIFSPQYIFFPAGFIFTIRFPMTEQDRQSWMLLRDKLTSGSGLLRSEREGAGAILRMPTRGGVTTEHVTIVDCSAMMIHLLDSLEVLSSKGMNRREEEYRPVVMNATEQGYIRLHPLRDDRGFLAYSVLPLDLPTVSLEQAIQKFQQAAQSLRAN